MNEPAFSAANQVQPIRDREKIRGRFDAFNRTVGKVEGVLVHHLRPELCKVLDSPLHLAQEPGIQDPVDAE